VSAWGDIPPAGAAGGSGTAGRARLLTDAGRAAITRARELAALDTAAVRAAAGVSSSDPADLAWAYAVAFGRAQVILARLAGLAERLAAALEGLAGEHEETCRAGMAGEAHAAAAAGPCPREDQDDDDGPCLEVTT
jgi:hypothetical protein